MRDDNSSSTSSWLEYFGNDSRVKHFGIFLCVQMSPCSITAWAANEAKLFRIRGIFHENIVFDLIGGVALFVLSCWRLVVFKPGAGTVRSEGGRGGLPYDVHCRIFFMRYDPQKHHRRSIRLRGYDYSQTGAYFVTICTQGRECLFGEIVDGAMRLNDAGRMLESMWTELPQYEGVAVDGFVVMPNHIHGIIVLTIGVGATPCGCPSQPCGCPSSGQAQGPAPTMSLPDVVHRFKSLTTARYRHGVAERGWRAFGARLWQRNYYEHVIRDEDELVRIRTYIEGNPEMWDIDRENPMTHPPQI